VIIIRMMRPVACDADFAARSANICTSFLKDRCRLVVRFVEAPRGSAPAIEATARQRSQAVAANPRGSSPPDSASADDCNPWSARTNAALAARVPKQRCTADRPRHVEPRTT
jgi:hypothetical protein